MNHRITKLTDEEGKHFLIVSRNCIADWTPRGVNVSADKVVLEPHLSDEQAVNEIIRRYADKGIALRHVEQPDHKFGPVRPKPTVATATSDTPVPTRDPDEIL